jgi:hypothetical protein
MKSLNICSSLTPTSDPKYVRESFSVDFRLLSRSESSNKNHQDDDGENNAFSGRFNFPHHEFTASATNKSHFLNISSQINTPSKIDSDRLI